ncbi:MAG: hypothetical protein AAGA43_16370 [Bacteroidota bacterium]
MKSVFKILTLLWLGIWVFAGISILLDTPGQINRDKDFIENEIKPSVDFIENFVSTHERLPSSREYYTWQREYHKDYSSDLTRPEDSLIGGLGKTTYIRKLSDVLKEDRKKFKDANWTTDYAISVWKGEWMEYYFSWTDTYDTNSFSWKDGILNLITTFTIGVIPLLFWLIKNKKGVLKNGNKP